MTMTTMMMMMLMTLEVNFIEQDDRRRRPECTERLLVVDISRTHCSYHRRL